MIFGSFSLFLIFYLSFKLNCYLIKSQKRGIYLQVLTWRAGKPATRHVARGPPRGCDAALRPRGRAAGGPRGAQEAHGAATWRRATRQREHMWAPVWGATCS